MPVESIRIGECPLCADSHNYVIEVEREFITGLATQPQVYRKASFVADFECPKRGAKFRGEITLSESTMKPVTSVTVLGLQQDEEWPGSKQ